MGGSEFIGSRQILDKALFLAAAMSGFLGCLVGIQWKAAAKDGFFGTFLVEQAIRALHIFNTDIGCIATVHGLSMLPAINLVGEVVAVDKVSMWLRKMAPGDIVMLISPENPLKTLVKRLLEMEGDSVTYLIDPGNTDASKTVVVPKGHAWVQSDNIYTSGILGNLAPCLMVLIQERFFRIWLLKSFGFIDPKE